MRMQRNPLPTTLPSTLIQRWLRLSKLTGWRMRQSLQPTTRLSKRSPLRVLRITLSNNHTRRRPLLIMLLSKRKLLPLQRNTLIINRKKP